MAKNTKVNLSEVLGELSEAQAEKVQSIQQSGGQVEVTKCVHCGKLLVRDISVEREEGDYCSHLFDELGHTKESLAQHRASMSASVVPDGYVKVASLHKILVREGIPVSHMVRAMGGDRGLLPAARPELVPIYVGNARWLNPWCASKEGLSYLRDYGTGSGKAPGATKTAKPSSIATQMEQLFGEPEG
jgi:hypothetical protein